MRLRLLVGVLALAVLALGLVFPWLKTPLLLALANGLAVAGVIVLIRAGQVSFGNAMFACLAGYGAAFMARAWHLDALLLIGLSAVLAALAGAVIGLFIVRYRGIFFGMLNLALSMVLFSVLGKFGAVTGGTDGLRFDRPTLGFVHLEREGFETALLVLALLMAIVAGWLVQRYFASVSGQALAAIKTNETRLEYLGISARRVFWGGYVLAATLCGLGGSLFALAQGLVTPEMGYWVRSGELVFIAILGGSGHALGAFIGAFVFEFMKLYAAALLTGAWQLVMGLVLLVMVFLAPHGVFGMIERRLRSGRSA
ncbi:branched-chain amino acid ABC transporter permease [Rhodoferax sp.]|uniref:branched-chain amino acid ABC transporter permease n=1 Tax=Rhodoferax sp. TaxID=50421 RepID=UPI0025CB86D8|nr:branched-chain amino acid ABC transporter permease [Rhodoferax sp.]MCM2297223.1 branched-chain amino acid ABC transporter permease [Rhodoferax sp.]